MISNFQIAQGASLPWLETYITKNGLVPMGMQAPDYGCADNKVDPNWLDLNAEVQSVAFELWKCGRVPQQVGLSGQAEKVDRYLVRYKFHPFDTAQKGCYYGRFVITMKDNTILKWPYQLEALSIEVL